MTGEKGGIGEGAGRKTRGKVELKKRAKNKKGRKVAGEKLRIGQKVVGKNREKNKKGGMSMKRMVAVLMVIVLFVLQISCALADGDRRSDLVEIVKTYCEDTLISLCGLYEKHPDSFDEDYMELTYRYYKMLLSTQEVYQKELEIDIRLNPLSGGKMFGAKRTTEEENIISEIVDDMWTKYLDGEVTKENFMGLMVAIVRGISEVRDEVDAIINAYE